MAGKPKDTTTTTDLLGRALSDLRISVTDRCNFRCRYCMPKEVFGSAYHFLPRAEILTFEEITRVAQSFAALGARKLRLTGGEPLVRRDLEHLVASLAAIPGIEDIAMTTNGSLLTATKARALKEAGLGRITVSLDSLDDDVFKSMNDVGFPVARVLDAIAAAQEAGLTPVKVNMVVKRGINQASIVPMAAHFRDAGVILRFIEYMDVGNSNGWQLTDVVSAKEILDTVGSEWPLEPIAPTRPGEVARRYRFLDGKGEIGIIASVTQPFCGGCSRARLSAEGLLYTCLFGTSGHDLRTVLRDPKADIDLTAYLRSIWARRSDRYSELRTAQTTPVPKVEMSHIGG